MVPCDAPRTYDDDARTIDLRAALDVFGPSLGLKRVMVEGGARTIALLLEPRTVSAWDALVVTVAPMYLGDAGVPVTPHVVPPARLARAFHLGADVVLVCLPSP